jgi:hypothetical protein
MRAPPAGRHAQVPAQAPRAGPNPAESNPPRRLSTGQARARRKPMSHLPPATKGGRRAGVSRGPVREAALTPFFPFHQETDAVFHYTGRWGPGPRCEHGSPLLQEPDRRQCARLESSNALQGFTRIHSAGSRRAPWSPCIGMPERRHRVRDHLEQPRWKRRERRRELHAAATRAAPKQAWRAPLHAQRCCTPLAREHHGDEHLEPLHALHADPSVTAVALVAVSRDG